MESMTIKETRKALRWAGKAARRAIAGEERHAAEQEMASRFAAEEAFRKARIVMSYKASDGEADLSLLQKSAAAAGKRFAFPVCRKDGVMDAYVPRTEDAFLKGAYGLWEPDPGRSDRVDPNEIDLILCPLTAFDETGMRLGMGGGYYDRFLPLCTNARIFGVAFEAQKMPVIPSLPYDVRMHGIVTEKCVYRLHQ